MVGRQHVDRKYVRFHGDPGTGPHDCYGAIYCDCGRAGDHSGELRGWNRKDLHRNGEVDRNVRSIISPVPQVRVRSSDANLGALRGLAPPGGRRIKNDAHDIAMPEAVGWLTQDLRPGLSYIAPPGLSPRKSLDIVILEEAYPPRSEGYRRRISA